MCKGEHFAQALQRPLTLVGGQVVHRIREPLHFDVGWLLQQWDMPAPSFALRCWKGTVMWTRHRRCTGLQQGGRHAPSASPHTALQLCAQS